MTGEAQFGTPHILRPIAHHGVRPCSHLDIESGCTGMVHLPRLRQLCRQIVAAYITTAPKSEFLRRYVVRTGSGRLF
jgi:hypothetical protein